MTDLAQRLRDAASRIGFYNGKGQWEPGALSVIVEAADAIDSLTAERDDNAKAFKATLRIVTANVEKTDARLAAAEAERDANILAVKSYLKLADRLAAAEQHLAEERKRLPAGLKPLHGPDCEFCVEKAYSSEPDYSKNWTDFSFKHADEDEEES